MLRQQRKDELKERIFSTALQLFQAKGFDRVTIDEITQQCGIAKGTFYNYFRSKDTILFHLGDSQMAAVRLIIERMAGVPSVKTRLEAIFRELFANLTANRGLVKVMLMELLRSEMMLAQEANQVRRFEQLLVPIMEEAAANKAIKAHLDPAQAASLLVSIYFQTVITWLSFPGSEEDPVNRFMAQLEMVWEGIGRSEYGGD